MSKSDIQFNPKQNIDFVKELRANVKQYFQKNNISTYADKSIIYKSILMFSLYAVPYILMISSAITSVWLVILSWGIMGLGMAGLGMVIMHDANHGTLTKNKKVNHWLSKTLYLLGGFPPNWRQQHNVMHHKYTNVTEMDEDINPIEILRFSPHKPLKKIHKYQHIYAWFFYGLMTISWITNKDFKQIFSYKKNNVKLDRKTTYRKFITDLIISKVLYYAVMLVIPLIFTAVAWYWVLAGFILMHFISGASLGVIFQTAHVMPENEFPLPKDNKIENNWTIHQLLTTSNYSPNNKVLSWLIGGLNYQVEHHLFPNISHVHYDKISELVKQTALKYGIPYRVQPSFAKAVSEHYKMLKALGTT